MAHKEKSKAENQTDKKTDKKESVVVSNLFTSIIQFRAQLSTLSDQIELRKPLEDTQIETLTRADATVGAILKQFNNIKEYRKEFDAFLLLLCITYTIQLYDPLEPADTIKDLLQCYDDIFTAPKGKQKKSVNNKDKAIAVLVDVVISLQAKPQFLIGSLSEYIIKCFAKQLTVESVDGIIKAITEYSLNKTEGEDDFSDDDEDDMMDEDDNEDDEDEDEDEEEDEDEDEEEGKEGNQNGVAEDESEESDIMIDDLDDDALKELDGVIAKLMQKERKPKMKQPHSSKEPDLDFRERVASLLHAYTKKAQTVAILELLPSLLEAIGQLQQQKAIDAKKTVDKDATVADRLEESKQRQRKTKFYDSVTSLIGRIIKDICHNRGSLVQQMTTTQRDKLYSTLSEYCYSQKGKEISELAGESMLLLNDTNQLVGLITDASKKAPKHTVQYLLRRICQRYPTQVLQDLKLLSYLLEHHHQHIQAFVNTLDTEALTTVGKSLSELFIKQVKSSAQTPYLPLLRTIIQKLVTKSGKEAVQKSFPTLIFSLNAVQQSQAYSSSNRKLARHIAALAFVGSQKSDTKAKKKETKLEREKEKEEKKNTDAMEESDEEDEEIDPKADQWKKGDLYYTKNKAYQKSRKRKSPSDFKEESDNKFKPKKKKDTKWFLGKK